MTLGQQSLREMEVFLLPGLIDAHIHLKDKPPLQQMAEHGITTSLDMAIWPPSKLDPLRGCRGLTDIRSAGLPAPCSGSIHSHIPPLPQEGFVSSPEDAAQFVQDRIMEGADWLVDSGCDSCGDFAPGKAFRPGRPWRCRGGGERADVILLARDPVRDIRATRSIRRIWCGGIEVKRSSKLV